MRHIFLSFIVDTESNGSDENFMSGEEPNNSTVVENAVEESNIENSEQAMGNELHHSVNEQRNGESSNQCIENQVRGSVYEPQNNENSNQVAIVSEVSNVTEQQNDANINCVQADNEVHDNVDQQNIEPVAHIDQIVPQNTFPHMLQNDLWSSAIHCSGQNQFGIDYAQPIQNVASSSAGAIGVDWNQFFAQSQAYYGSQNHVGYRHSLPAISPLFDSTRYAQPNHNMVTSSAINDWNYVQAQCSVNSPLLGSTGYAQPNYNMASTINDWRHVHATTQAYDNSRNQFETGHILPFDSTGFAQSNQNVAPVSVPTQYDTSIIVLSDNDDTPPSKRIKIEPKQEPLDNSIILHRLVFLEKQNQQLTVHCESLQKRVLELRKPDGTWDPVASSTMNEENIDPLSASSSLSSTK